MQIIKAPLQLFPLVLGALTDAGVALERIGTFLTAEELKDRYVIDHGLEWGAEVEGDFVWEAVGGAKSKGSKGEVEKRVKGKEVAEKAGGEENDAREEEEKPFNLRDLRLRIPRGSFVAIIGRVGSGKVYIDLFIL